MRQSRNGTQLQLPSRKATRSRGWRSRMPPAQKAPAVEHLLDRMGVDVLQHRVGAELLADLPELRARRPRGSPAGLRAPRARPRAARSTDRASSVRSPRSAAGTRRGSRAPARTGASPPPRRRRRTARSSRRRAGARGSPGRTRRASRCTRAPWPRRVAAPCREWSGRRARARDRSPRRRCPRCPSPRAEPSTSSPAPRTAASAPGSARSHARGGAGCDPRRGDPPPRLAGAGQPQIALRPP